ncbi:hypothetical protein PR048_028387 [Dryococelus australis]|uniref:Uncharacterized protein n=1 Tax=Dryococelus australis TaxID=614101 RepID=A0ABQ9GD22_9NEOP|nr:hypothetical protein PR048_028387 [Dryococelus australis]
MLNILFCNYLFTKTIVKHTCMDLKVKFTKQRNYMSLAFPKHHAHKPFITPGFKIFKVSKVHMYASVMVKRVHEVVVRIVDQDNRLMNF